MTLKISSVKLWKESIKRNFAMGALLMLVYFIIFLVGGMVILYDYGRADWSTRADLQEWMREFLAFDAPLLVLTMIFAVIIAILEFCYLHSKEKLDFYHSFPVRREQFFIIHYLSGIVLWLVPYAVNLFLVLCLASVKGCADILLWEQACQGMGIQLAAFLVIYSFMVLFMMLTGKIFTAILGMGVACIYFPAALFLQEGMHEVYYTTYLNQGNVALDYMMLSPIYACIDLMKRFASAERSARDMVLGLVILSLLMAGISVYLYRQRASESAGRTVAFSGIARVIKFLLVIPFSLTGNLLFYELGGNYFWGFFGLIFGLAVSTAIVEFIYCLDIREIFSDKRQILLTFVVSFGILMFFQFDLSSFDKKLPAESQVESVAFDQCSVGYYGPLASMQSKYVLLTTAEGKIVYQLQTYVEKEDYPVSDLEAAYALLEQRLSSSDSGDADQNRITVGVTYYMKDGTQKQRRYIFAEETLDEYFEPIWQDEEYKEKSIPVLTVDFEKVLDISAGENEYQGYVSEGNVSLCVPSDAEELEEEYVEEISAESLEGERMELDRDQEKEVFETLCEELRSVTLHQLRDAIDSEETLPWLNIVYLSEDGEVYGDSFFVSDAFPKTKALLEKWGGK